MLKRLLCLFGAAAALSLAAFSVLAESGNERVEAAISAIRILDRPGRINLATVWDGNKYVQCRRMADRALRCEREAR